MGGNVWEWNETIQDPTNGARGVRGGACVQDAAFLMASWYHYSYNIPNGQEQDFDLGFRVAAAWISSVAIKPVPGQSAWARLVFGPLVPGSTYTVQSSPGLSPADWTALLDTTQTDDGSFRTVTDLNATGTQKFYRVLLGPP